MLHDPIISDPRIGTNNQTLLLNSIVCFYGEIVSFSVSWLIAPKIETVIIIVRKIERKPPAMREENKW